MKHLCYNKSMTKDLTNVYKKYKGKWVAMDNNFAKVVLSGNSSSSVYRRAQKKGYKTPNLFRVPSNLNGFIG